MKCKNHSEEVAIERCSICGNWFCEDCITVDSIKASCNICLGQKTPNKEKTIIREVIEEPGTIQKPKEETTQRVVVKPVPQGAHKKPRKIISNGEMVDADNPLEIARHNNRMKNQIINRQKYEVTNYDSNALKKGIWRIAAGIIVMMVGGSIGFSIVSVVGVVMVITALIDIKSNN